MVEPLLHDRTTLIAAQNGIPWWYFHGVDGRYAGHRIDSVDPGGSVSAALPVERAVVCVVYAATEIASPGVIRHLEGSRFSIGEPTGEISTRCTTFADAMIAGGLKCPVEPDLRKDIWLKLMGNIAFNPISALTRATMAGICRHLTTRELVVQMMRETLDVAARLGAPPATRGLAPPATYHRGGVWTRRGATPSTPPPASAPTRRSPSSGGSRGPSE